MVSILEQRDFALAELRLLASARSAGRKIETRWGEVEVENLEEADPSGIDIALFSAGGDRSRAFAPSFVSAGAVVIDNSSAFRQQPQVPLVVVGVNDHAAHRHEGLIANPNCTTMALMMAAGPLHHHARIERLTASSYQSVGGSGQAGMSELSRQVSVLASDPDALADGTFKDPGANLYVSPIAFNVIPFAGNESRRGYTDEEWKLVNETRKILEDETILVEPTCVRVPVMVGHSVSASMFFSRSVALEEALTVLADAPGLQLWTDRVPTPLDAAGEDDVLCGRVRETLGENGGINLWVVGDNIRKGAALNAVQIAELIS
jgi:aspartate-semialdehyde dehydrogenase